MSELRQRTLALAIMVSGVLVASSMLAAHNAAAGSRDVFVHVSALERTAEFNGGTARFSTQLTIGPTGEAGGPVLILLGPGGTAEADKFVLRVEEGRAAVDSAGEVSGVEVAGTVLHTYGHPRGDFTARVTPSSGDPDCLIFDLDGAGITGRLVAEGTMTVIADPTDDDTTR